MSGTPWGQALWREGHLEKLIGALFMTAIPLWLDSNLHGVSIFVIVQLP